jgi:hypothetical protein
MASNAAAGFDRGLQRDGVGDSPAVLLFLCCGSFACWPTVDGGDSMAGGGLGCAAERLIIELDRGLQRSGQTADRRRDQPAYPSGEVGKSSNKELEPAVPYGMTRWEGVKGLTHV